MQALSVDGSTFDRYLRSYQVFSYLYGENGAIPHDFVVPGDKPSIGQRCKLDKPFNGMNIEINILLK